ncbi:cupin domain-containing protein [Terriglobus roseus DSM 18391]|uniref:Cupin domain-containing protein n=1 Tax=Terriglobus roseus (strain DSM 18391 / NRRL B-41598 / KBS 63) TaxID=926566 RepID=I3ZL20_TERRK|nr:cupin domain-containing protein [Terriglobus roseus]AFL89938.1 cupin domain-containing protein [Terriglobus roseus DSM 18391]
MLAPTYVPAARLVEADPLSSMEVLGVTVTPLVSSGETDGQFALFQALVPHNVGIPVHSHPDVEFFYVLEGSLTVLRQTDDVIESFQIGARQGGFVPSNALHGFVNSNPETAHVLIACTSGLEAFLSEAGTPLGESAPRIPPNGAEIERVLAIARKHGQVFAPPC